MVGRDIGTVVLPGADLKLYLDAQVEARALRRYRELVARRQQADYDSVLTAMRRRDEIDSGREVSPLRPAQDAIIIDTSDLSVEEVLELVTGLIQEHGHG
jgi:cytidylate kinase